MSDQTKFITDLKTVCGHLGLAEDAMDNIGIELDDRDLGVSVHSNTLREIIAEYLADDVADKFDDLGLDGWISIDDL